MPKVQRPIHQRKVQKIVETKQDICEIWLTTELANGTKIPREKTPKRDPATAPSKLTVACTGKTTNHSHFLQIDSRSKLWRTSNIVLTRETRKTMEKLRTLNMREIPFTMRTAVRSCMFGKRGRTRSSRMIRETAFRTLERVLEQYTIQSKFMHVLIHLFNLSAPLKIPATKRPGSPGILPRTSMIKKGTIWSALSITCSKTKAKLRT